ncbi:MULTISPECIES: hypothetical protein [Streptomyces]|uniref:DUF7848 domain-containing protein n=2 Tax=Streptomyces TaxID=1883 RepID=A0A100Y645_9ACTN|nr:MULTISPECIES: hypothetical protein [Streptomyces]KUH38355.1 hypothetical protein ATE80_12855 [Streptomyces kanasensis]UUS30800.1 hypothetical protein NRO40_08105 [Streptomyces changanensis]
MTRTYRLVRHRLAPHRDEGAPPLTHRFRCTALDGDGTKCGAESAAFGNAGDAQPWTFSHLRDHPGHTTFLEVIERPWVLLREGRP